MNDPYSKDDHLVRSYLSLRKAVGILGMALPFLLALGGRYLLGMPLQPSISGYYHTAMRDVFVGSLCAIAVFLWSYRGYQRRDRIAGNLASIFALGVALVPTAGPEAAASEAMLSGRLHMFFTVAFFLTLAYFSLFLFRLSDRTRPSRRKMLSNAVYLVSGYVILVCVLAMGLVSFEPVASMVRGYKPVFWLESGAILAFGASWFVKGQAILKDREPQSPAERVAPRIPGRSPGNA